MAGLGIVPGDRVAILARNGFRYLESIFACSLMAHPGAAQYSLSSRKLVHRGEDAVRLIFCGSSFHVNGAARTIGWADELAAGSIVNMSCFLATGRLQGVLVKKRDFRYRAGYSLPAEPPLPKGVCLTHRQSGRQRPRNAWRP